MQAKTVTVRGPSNAGHHRAAPGAGHDEIDAPLHRVVEGGAGGRPEADAHGAGEEDVDRHHSGYREEHSHHRGEDDGDRDLRLAHLEVGREVPGERGHRPGRRGARGGNRHARPLPLPLPLCSPVAGWTANAGSAGGRGRFASESGGTSEQCGNQVMKVRPIDDAS